MFPFTLDTECQGEGHMHADEAESGVDAATSQKMLTATRSWKRQAREPPREPLEGARPCHPLTSDFWPPDLRKNKYVLL